MSGGRRTLERTLSLAVALGLAQAAQDLDAFAGVNVAVQVADAHADVTQVIGQILGGAFGERGDEHAFLLRGALANLFEQVVDLSLERFDCIQQDGVAKRFLPKLGHVFYAGYRLDIASVSEAISQPHK